MLRRALLALLVIASFDLCTPEPAFSQGETTSAIVGEVRDVSGATVPNAIVTVTNKETSLRRNASTDDAGRFNFPQLKPGTYIVRVEAEGFEPQENDSVISALGQKQNVDFTLQVAQSKQTVEIRSETPILNPENANTSTTLSAHTLENLPNPGGDLTYPLQFAAGALINTAGSGNDFVGGTNGYGNVEFNGLPALSNGYIVDGLETNDPLTNLNSGLSTNLVLGLNSISEVTVNTLSYAVDQGRYGASQVNYVTKSGSNQFHGNLYELWNGSRFNAANYFTNATPGNHKPRSTVNHFGGSLGGPIIHDKLFFFFDSEWVRIALAHRHRHHGSHSRVPELRLAAASARRHRFRHRLDLSAVAAIGARSIKRCSRSTATRTERLSPFSAAHLIPAAARPAIPNDGNGCANRQSVSHSSDDHEQVQTVRIDYNIDEKNTTWFRFQTDNGLQAAYTDPINPLFNALSPQPLYSFAAGYTHVFSQNLVNYFNPAFSWYGSLFGPSDFRKRSPHFRSSSRESARMPRSPPSAGSTTPGSRAAAPRAFSSTTISPGAMARTNSASAPTRAFFA